VKFRKVLKRFEKKLERLKTCFYALEVGTVFCSALDKIFTFVAITYYGAREVNPIAAGLMNIIGVGPAVVLGFLATMSPLVCIHYGIRRFKWNKERHYWIYTIFMTFYFTIFYKLVEFEMKQFGWLR